MATGTNKTKSALDAQANVIHDETATDGNTASRIGLMILDVLESLFTQMIVKTLDTDLLIDSDGYNVTIDIDGNSKTFRVDNTTLSGDGADIMLTSSGFLAQVQQVIGNSGIFDLNSGYGSILYTDVSGNEVTLRVDTTGVTITRNPLGGGAQEVFKVLLNGEVHFGGVKTNVFSDAEKTKLGNLFEGYLGFFATEAALNTAHPTGSNGQHANVGSTDTMWAWDSDTNAWVDTGSSSSGDMLKATYDPTSKNASAFSMDNMDETATKKILTDTERALFPSIDDRDAIAVVDFNASTQVNMALAKTIRMTSALTGARTLSVINEGNTYNEINIVVDDPSGFEIDFDAEVLEFGQANTNNPFTIRLYTDGADHFVAEYIDGNILGVDVEIGDGSRVTQGDTNVEQLKNTVDNLRQSQLGDGRTEEIANGDITINLDTLASDFHTVDLGRLTSNPAFSFSGGKEGGRYRIAVRQVESGSAVDIVPALNIQRNGVQTTTNGDATMYEVIPESGDYLMNRVYDYTPIAAKEIAKIKINFRNNQASTEDPGGVEQFNDFTNGAGTGVIANLTDVDGNPIEISIDNGAFFGTGNNGFNSGITDVDSDIHQNLTRGYFSNDANATLPGTLVTHTFTVANQSYLNNKYVFSIQLLLGSDTANTPNPNEVHWAVDDENGLGDAQINANTFENLTYENEYKKIVPKAGTNQFTVKYYAPGAAELVLNTAILRVYDRL